METSSSPWSRAGGPSATLPPPPASATPVLNAPPGPTSPPINFQHGRITRRQTWPWAALALLITVVISAATGSIVTYAATHNEARSATKPSSMPSASTSAPTAPQFSVADVTAAKSHLCQVFDVSVRGQQGQGGMRVDGNLNVPIVLRSVNSVLAVQTALVPAVPADVASAARNYIQSTLDLTTAAMGNTSTAEGNRLNDVSNDATNALLDACGLPR